MLSFPEELYYAGDSIVSKYSFEKIQNTLRQMYDNKVLTAVLSDKIDFDMNYFNERLKMKYTIFN